MPVPSIDLNIYNYFNIYLYVSQKKLFAVHIQVKESLQAQDHIKKIYQ